VSSNFLILLQVHEPKQKVDLTAYTEKHEFVFDAVLNDQVTNDEVRRAFQL
jgi:kinesin family protein 2/24